MNLKKVFNSLCVIKLLKSIFPSQFKARRVEALAQDVGLKVYGDQFHSFINISFYNFLIKVCHCWRSLQDCPEQLHKNGKNQKKEDFISHHLSHVILLFIFSACKLVDYSIQLEKYNQSIIKTFLLCFFFVLN